MAEVSLLSTKQVAAFVADGYLRFDALVPPAISTAVLRELTAGGPPSSFGAAAQSPARTWTGQPLAGLFRDWRALAALVELLDPNVVLKAD